MKPTNTDLVTLLQLGAEYAADWLDELTHGVTKGIYDADEFAEPITKIKVDLAAFDAAIHALRARSAGRSADQHVEFLKRG